MHKRVRTHTLTGVAESVTTLYYEGKKKKKGKSFSDECSKDSEPVKGDAQPNTGGAFVWREGNGAGGRHEGVVMT